MHFSSSALTAVLGLSTVIVSSGYTHVPSFTRGVASKTTTTSVSFSRSSRSSPWSDDRRTRHSRTGCDCSSCTRRRQCRPGCNCSDCYFPSSLMMSTEEITEAPAEEVPAEVEAMDGIASEEEAHNVERPKTSLQKRKSKPRGVALSELTEGSTVMGKIKTITSYGAFVDIGAATDALLHVSRMSDEFVSKVEDIVQVGQEVQVRIVKIDEEKKQVAVSMRSEEADQKGDQRGAGGKRRQRPQRSSGDRAAQMKLLSELNEKGFDSNKMIEGSVVSTLDFGAFVRIATADLVEGTEGEVDGLVHISQLTAGRVDNVESVVKVGQKVQVRVKSVDSEGGKVSLSMITEEEDNQNPKKGGGRMQGGKPFGGMYSDAEMGAKDWKEKLEKFSAEQPVFTNSPVIVDRRK